MTDVRDDLFNDEDDEDEESSDDTAGSGVSKGDDDAKSDDKRVRDLQSKADKETARANKAEKELERLRTGASGAEGGKPPASGGGVQVEAGLLEMARMFAVQQNPRLAEYGLSSTDLTGNTPAEVAASASELVARYEKLETQMRNKVLAEHGMAPEIEAGAAPSPSRDFSKMSSEEFNKLVDETMGKRR